MEQNAAALSDRIGASAREAADRVTAEIAAMEQAAGSVADAVGDRARMASDRLLGEITSLQDTAASVADLVGERAKSTNDQLLAEIAALRETAEEVARSVGDRATASVQQAQQEIEVLRRASEEAADTISERTITSADAVVSQLDRVRASAEEIRNTLAQAADNSADVITAHLRDLTEAADRESSRAASTVRSNYESASQEIADLVGAATGRLAESGDAMRKAAREMIEELELTRNELQRGAMDLPREVTDSSKAMRRAVSDQVKALNELSDIVTRHGRNLDVATPPQRTVASSASASERPAARQPAREPVRVPSSREYASASAAPVAPRRTEAAAPPPPARERQPLADTLGRLHREEQRAEPTHAPRNPAHILETLNATAVDIVRALNDGSYAELYERYRRGDRDIFVRRLYARRDNGVMDELRRKYRSDNELRSAVDRYMDEFEGLLGEIAAQDHDGTMRQMYLTSEPSKVFAMLAEVTGRTA